MKKKTPTPTMGRELMSTLRAAERALTRLRDEELASLDLSGAQADVIRVLSKSNNPVSLLELRDLLDNVSTPPSRLISVLVGKNLVDRTERKEDRRVCQISITAKGAKLAKKVEKIDKALERRVAKEIALTTIQSATRAMKTLATM